MKKIEQSLPCGPQGQRTSSPLGSSQSTFASVISNGRHLWSVSETSKHHNHNNPSRTLRRVSGTRMSWWEGTVVLRERQGFVSIILGYQFHCCLYPSSASHKNASSIPRFSTDFLQSNEFHYRIPTIASFQIDSLSNSRRHGGAWWKSRTRKKGIGEVRISSLQNLAHLTRNFKKTADKGLNQTFELQLFLTCTTTR